MRRLMLAALLALALSGPAAADYWSEFEAGVDAFAEGRHDAALGHFRPLAERGDNRSQYWLGIMYFEGKGVPEDFDVARVTWLWRVTTEADKAIVERNQQGVNSRYYVPGPYAPMENYCAWFVDWYLAAIA